MTIFADDSVKQELNNFTNIANWIKIIKFIPEVQEIETKFEI